MDGVNAAAQQKADALATGGNGAGAKKAGSISAVDAAILLQGAREEAEDLRAAILDRHRFEWGTVGALVNEAQARREGDPVDAFNRMKLAKITAETISLRQAGERKAWGMDAQGIADMSKMTDAQLEAIAAGKMPR